MFNLLFELNMFFFALPSTVSLNLLIQFGSFYLQICWTFTAICYLIDLLLPYVSETKTKSEPVITLQKADGRKYEIDS
jgi:hypothetical protein